MHVAGFSTRLPLKRTGQSTSCAEAMTLKCLQALYNIPSTPATAAGNGIAIGGSSAQVADLDDLKVCFAFFRYVLGQYHNTFEHRHFSPGSGRIS